MNLKNTMLTSMTTALLSLMFVASTQATELETICYRVEASVESPTVKANPVTGEITNFCQSLEGEATQDVMLDLYTSELPGIDQPFAQLQVTVDPAKKEVTGLRAHHSTGTEFLEMTPMSGEITAIEDDEHAIFDLKHAWSWMPTKKAAIDLQKKLIVQCEMRFVDKCL